MILKQAFKRKAEEKDLENLQLGHVKSEKANWGENTECMVTMLCTGCKGPGVFTETMGEDPKSILESLRLPVRRS